MVEAQIVREVEREPTAKDKPEPWVMAEAVKLTNKAAGHQPPKHLEVQTSWVLLGDESRVLLQDPGLEYAASAKTGDGENRGEFLVNVSMRSGDARGELLRSVAARLGARRVLEISSARTYRALRVVSAEMGSRQVDSSRVPGVDSPSLE